MKYKLSIRFLTLALARIQRLILILRDLMLYLRSLGTFSLNFAELVARLLAPYIG